MFSHLRPAAVMLAAMTLLTGLAYPLAITRIAGAVAPEAAAGSLMTRDGVIVGSSLIGQGFAGEGYLHPRPSASGWNAAASGASNLGPTTAALIAAVVERRAGYEAENGVAAPVDAITTSASGLDPDISPENAAGQAARIAVARGVAPAEVARLIAGLTQGRWIGLYGLPRVNVLQANLALDAAFPLTPTSPEN